MERYDRLAEEMELLKQKCEGLLQAERADFKKQLSDAKNDARVKEKKLKAENRLVV